MAEYYSFASESPQYPSMRPTMASSAQPAAMPMVPPTQVQGPVKSQAMRYSQGGLTFDGQEIVKRAFKYLLEGVIVSLVAAYLSKGQNFDLHKVVVIGVTAAVVFALLDQVAPSVASGARTGAGFGLGYGAYGLALPVSNGVMPNAFA